MIQTLLHRLKKRQRIRSVDSAAALRHTLLWLGTAFAAHVLAMMAFEGMAPMDAIWLTVVTATTVGYGDLSAKTDLGRWSTIILVFGGMIFVLANFVSDFIDMRAAAAATRRSGKWDWKMEDHLLIVGTPSAEPTAFYVRLVRQLRASTGWAEVPVQLLTRAYDGRDGRDACLPQDLRDLDIVHVTGRGVSEDALALAGAARARAVLILADAENDPACDAAAFDLVHRIREMSVLPGGPLLVSECVDDRNRGRLLRAGCHAVLRPLRAYPEMIARAVASPRSEEILEELFTAEGNELHRVALPRVWEGNWTDALVRIASSGMGTPLAYEDEDQRVHTNPLGRTIRARALFILADDAQDANLGRVAELLAPRG